MRILEEEKERKKHQRHLEELEKDKHREQVMIKMQNRAEHRKMQIEEHRMEQEQKLWEL